MDFIIEVVFEFFGFCLEETFESKKVKVWTKTVLFILLTQAITALMVWGAVYLFQNQDGAGYVLAALATAWGIGMLIATVYSHKRNWKKDY